MLGTLIFVIYVNNLPQRITCDVKLFDDDGSLFLIINYSKISASVLNSNLLKIEDWAYQWKVKCNPDQAKQEQEAIFLRKTNKIAHPPLYFNNIIVNLTHA